MPDREIIELRHRILGILIRGARERARRSRSECAEILGISTPRLTAYEEGRKAISLPELELLARYLEAPLRDFRKSDNTSFKRVEETLPDPGIFLPLRHRMVGARLKQARVEAGWGLQDLAEVLGCSSGVISGYEFGERPIPLAELEVAARALGIPMDYFLDRHSDVGEWHALQEEFQRFVELPIEMREFLLRPINRSYIELAMKLAQMPAGALRQIAEGLLEITY
jgi:transcriptional regulator with XRE-family HTH domain